MLSKVIIALYILTTSSALVVLKLGAKAGPPLQYAGGKLQFNLNLYAISGIALYFLSFITYVYLISKYDLGYIIPLLAAFVYVLIFVASYFIFKEVFTLTKIIGIGLILAGLFFLNFRR